MAKKNYDIDIMFGEMAERRKGMTLEPSKKPEVEVVAEPVAEEPAVTVKEEPKVEVTFAKPIVEPQKERKEKVNKFSRKQENKETSLQGNKEKKKPSDYYYGTKRTHAYPDELWRKFDIILKFKGEKQNAKLIELVTNYVEENIEIVEMWDKMQGDRK